MSGLKPVVSRVRRLLPGSGLGSEVAGLLVDSDDIVPPVMK